MSGVSETSPNVKIAQKTKAPDFGAFVSLIGFSSYAHFFDKYIDKPRITTIATQRKDMIFL